MQGITSTRLCCCYILPVGLCVASVALGILGTIQGIDGLNRTASFALVVGAPIWLIPLCVSSTPKVDKIDNTSSTSQVRSPFRLLADLEKQVEQQTVEEFNSLNALDKDKYSLDVQWNAWVKTLAASEKYVHNLGYLVKTRLDSFKVIVGLLDQYWDEPHKIAFITGDEYTVQALHAKVKQEKIVYIHLRPPHDQVADPFICYFADLGSEILVQLHEKGVFPTRRHQQAYQKFVQARVDYTLGSSEPKRRLPNLVA